MKTRTIDKGETAEIDPNKGGRPRGRNKTPVEGSFDAEVAAWLKALPRGRRSSVMNAAVKAVMLAANATKTKK